MPACAKLTKNGPIDYQYDYRSGSNRKARPAAFSVLAGGRNPSRFRGFGVVKWWEYGMNNPVTFTDHTGLKPSDFTGADWAIVRAALNIVNKHQTPGASIDSDVLYPMGEWVGELAPGRGAVTNMDTGSIGINVYNLRRTDWSNEAKLVWAVANLSNELYHARGKKGDNESTECERDLLNRWRDSLIGRDELLKKYNLGDSTPEDYFAISKDPYLRQLQTRIDIIDRVRSGYQPIPISDESTQTIQRDVP